MADIKQTDLNVELGPGLVPILGHLRKDLFGSGPAIFIDANRQSLKNIREDFSSKFPPEIYRVDQFPTALPLQADVKNIPLAPNSCQIIFASNLLGSLKVGIKEVESEVNKYAKDLYEKIKPGGRIVLLETYSPNIVPENMAERVFTTTGFRVAEQHRGDEIRHIFDNSNAVSVKAVLDLRSPDLSYALVLEKPVSS